LWLAKLGSIDAVESNFELLLCISEEGAGIPIMHSDDLAIDGFLKVPHDCPVTTSQQAQNCITLKKSEGRRDFAGGHGARPRLSKQGTGILW
jgi:hypothetical protein